MLIAIAHHEVGHVEQHIVGGDLGDDLVGEGYALGLVLHDGEWLTVFAVEDGVAAQLLGAYAQLHLIAHEGRGIALVVYEIVDKMLAHPLLGGEGHITLTQHVEHFWLSVLRLSYLYVGIFGKEHCRIDELTIIGSSPLVSTTNRGSPRAR